MKEVKTIQEFYEIAQDAKPGAVIPISGEVMRELSRGMGFGPVITQDLNAMAQIKHIFEPLHVDEKIRILSYLTSQEVANEQTT